MTLWTRLTPYERAAACEEALQHVDSASEIARYLEPKHGLITRNSIIGVCFRNQIQLRGNRLNYQALSAAKRKKKQDRPIKPNIIVLLPPVNKPQKRTTLPTMLFIEAASGRCRFPMWDDGTPVESKMVCGDVAIGSWCREHLAMVYQPANIVNDRRRKLRREHRA